MLVRDFLPPDIELTLSLRAMLEGLLLGVFVVAAFTFIPLYRLGELRPSFIFRKEPIGLQQRWPYVVAVALMLGAFGAMVYWLLGEVRTSLYFVAAVLGLLAIASLLTEVDAASVAPPPSPILARAPGAARPLPPAQPDAGHHHHAVGQPGGALLHLPGRADPGRQLCGRLPGRRAQRLLPRHPA